MNVYLVYVCVCVSGEEGGGGEGIDYSSNGDDKVKRAHSAVSEQWRLNQMALKRG